MRLRSDIRPALFVVAALALISCGPAGSPARTPPRAPIVFATWVKDPSVDSGPYPGYRPQISAIDRRMVTSVVADLDPNGTDWVVSYTLNAAGTRLFASITSQAAAACSDGCPESRVTIWLDLNQDDVEHWNERATMLYRPNSQGGKLVSDPIIQAPITGGEAYIAGNFNQQQATDLARRMNGS